MWTEKKVGGRTPCERQDFWPVVYTAARLDQGKITTSATRAALISGPGVLIRSIKKRLCGVGVRIAATGTTAEVQAKTKRAAMGTPFNSPLSQVSASERQPRAASLGSDTKDDSAHGDERCNFATVLEPLVRYYSLITHTRCCSLASCPSPQMAGKSSKLKNRPVFEKTTSFPWNTPGYPAEAGRAPAFAPVPPTPLGTPAVWNKGMKAAKESPGHKWRHQEIQNIPHK